MLDYFDDFDGFDKHFINSMDVFLDFDFVNAMCDAMKFSTSFTYNGCAYMVYKLVERFYLNCKSNCVFHEAEGIRRFGFIDQVFPHRYDLISDNLVDLL